MCTYLYDSECSLPVKPNMLEKGEMPSVCGARVYHLELIATVSADFVFLCVTRRCNRHLTQHWLHATA